MPAEIIPFPIKRPAFLFLVGGVLAVRRGAPTSKLHDLAAAIKVPRSAFRYMRVGNGTMPHYPLFRAEIRRAIACFGPMPDSDEAYLAMLEACLRPTRAAKKTTKTARAR